MVKGAGPARAEFDDAGFPRKHEGYIEVDARAAACRHLGGARREPGSAHVLNADEQPAPDELQAGLEQQLLREGIAHLHLGASVGALVQLLGGEGRAVDAIPARPGPDGHHRVSDALGQSLRQLLEAEEPDAHHVDQRIPLVSRIEHRLAAHGGHADAVPVIAYAAHHAVEQVAGSR